MSVCQLLSTDVIASPESLRKGEGESETGRLSFLASLDFQVHSMQRDNKIQMNNMQVKEPHLALS